MVMKLGRSSLPWFALALLGSCPLARAQADSDKQQCAAAYESAQETRDAGRLTQARGHAVQCANEACPEFIRQDCTRWVSELESSIPTLVIVARDASGQDLAAVRVEVDGELVAERLDGTGLELDPGEHRLTLTTEGAEPLTRTLVLRVGERNRRLEVDFEAPEAASQPAPAEDSGTAAPQAGDGRAGPPLAAWVLGGLGVAALGGFAYFGLSGRSDQAELEDTCAPRCSDADVDALDRKLLLADVSLVISLASLGVATYLFLDAPAKPPPTQEAARRRQPRSPQRPELGFAALPGSGAYGVLRQRF